MKKIGRNDPCHCGSGKKFKKCCESKMLGKRFMATRIDAASGDQMKKTVSMAPFFHERLSLTPKKPMPNPEPVKDEEKGEITEALTSSVAEKGKIC